MSTRRPKETHLIAPRRDFGPGPGPEPVSMVTVDHKLNLVVQLAVAFATLAFVAFVAATWVTRASRGLTDPSTTTTTVATSAPNVRSR